jgi:hypothetical protein
MNQLETIKDAPPGNRLADCRMLSGYGQSRPRARRILERASPGDSEPVERVSERCANDSSSSADPNLHSLLPVIFSAESARGSGVAGPQCWITRQIQTQRFSSSMMLPLGISPNRCTLQAYAYRLGFHSAALPLDDRGYVRLENENVVVIFDAAVLGPDYQPGHADTLSFELSNRGQRVLVNSGTSTYESNSVRSFERGAAAHNTVRIDSMDQSEMWAAFRVARPARPHDVHTRPPFLCRSRTRRLSSAPPKSYSQAGN